MKGAGFVLCKLIIVEDEKIIRENLRKLDWESIEIEVVETFNNGETALEYARNYPVDIALVDVRMPVMDGMEFAKKVKEEELGIAIVCQSGYSDYSYLRECLQHGVRDYLLKPTDKDELFQIMSKLVLEKREQDSAEGPVKDMYGNEESVNHKISKAKEYIMKNYKKSIRLIDVANFLQLNPAYFSRIFRQKTGVCFVDYLTEFRINKAIELLKNSNMNISEIAEEVGFIRARYFTEIFKKRKGMTPSEYRNKK